MLNNMGRVTGQREVRPVWNNAQRVNHQNILTHPHPKRNFVPTAVLTKSGNVLVNTAKVNNVTTAGTKAIVSAVQGHEENVVKSSACWIWRPTGKIIDHISKDSGSYMPKRFNYGNPQYAFQDQGIFDSGCSRHMTRNKSYLIDYQDIDGGFVAFVGSPKGGKIRTGKLDFEDVYFVKELKFNLFSVLQMCNKKNSVLFTEIECLILSPDFKLLDESQVLLKVPRQNNMYSFNLKNVVPSGGLTCLFAKATIDESNLWHMRLGHVNYKTMNKLVRGNLVRGLSSKLFENDHTCVAYQKGKQHKASCKTKLVSSISQPLQMLHMDLFGPTFVKSLHKKMYCLVVTDDFSRFSWVFFFASKDETSFCEMKGIKREFSVARTPQKNRVAERKNRTLIVEARTMLTNSLLPTTFWAEPINSACYVQNRVLITKPHNKTPYELLIGRSSDLAFFVAFLVKSQNSPVNPSVNNDLPTDPLMPDLEDSTGIFRGVYDDEDVGAEADLNNLETTMNVSPIPITRIHKDHPKTDIRDINSAIQIRRMINFSEENAMVSYISKQRRTNHKDYQNCLFACFLLQIEPKKVIQALKDPSWIEAMQKELL
ncbi:putative ribonuclease H-like domain-containing protein [Tanacetum coccineum]